LENGHEIRVEIPLLDGSPDTTFVIRQDEKQIHIQRSGPQRFWNVSLVGMESTDGLKLIKMDAQISDLKIELK
jgi:hypothetical protein